MAPTTKTNIYKDNNLDKEKYAYKDINKDNRRSEHQQLRPQEMTWDLQSLKSTLPNGEVNQSL